MTSELMNTWKTVFRLLLNLAVVLCLCASSIIMHGQQSKQAPAGSPSGPQGFATPDKAVETLVAAAENFDVPTLTHIFGPDGENVVFTGEVALDRQHAKNFAAEAHELKKVTVDPVTGSRAFLLVGKEEWPFPVPLVKKNKMWFFDSKAGRQELLYRRVGANELDAIQLCHGYVEAQYEYAFEPRQGYDVNQFAQRVISSPGKQDGLAWQNADGSWGGPVGEKIAQAIDEGYSSKSEPYHGYFFKILKGQGPDAPLGAMNYVIEGVMIGGFGLVAAPAEYGITGVNTFIVSQDGVVYQKDFGPNTLNVFKNMELFNPDKSWTPLPEEDK